MKDQESSTDALSVLDKHQNGIPIRGDKSLNESHRFLQQYSDEDLQAYLLDGVSRTFALTIPVLPPRLRHIVSNAYLLCRIVDTIEDSALSPSQKEMFCNRFIEVVKSKEKIDEFVNDLSPLLTNQTKQAEHELIALTARIIEIAHRFDVPQRKALERCIRIMAEGMAHFQEETSVRGLQNVEEINDYCYCVAGVVGEMLTDLFCLYSQEIEKNRQQLMKLSVRFGQALQMTNILKDIWEDYKRSTCWLPRDVFNKEGFDLDNLRRGESNEKFQNGLEYLIGMTHNHLQKAFEYTLLIPPGEKGIRQFCLWALGMAVLTLKKINKNKGFTHGDQVKISRKSVKATIMTINLTVKHDRLLRIIFNTTRSGLPCHPD